MLVLVVYGGLLALTYWGFTQRRPASSRRRTRATCSSTCRLPDSASVDADQEVMQQIEEIALKIAGVKHTVAIAGQSILLNANAPNFGAMYVMLKDFHERPSRTRPAKPSPQSSRRRFKSEVPEGRSTSSALRRSKGWARPAASRS